MSSTEADASSWASVPWTPVTGDSTGTIIGWHKAGVPYLPRETATSLQTLDVWIPARGSTDTPPDASALPSAPDGNWIIYIHGGAWRDPRITSSSFSPTAIDLLGRLQTSSSSSSSSHSSDLAPPHRPIAGLASLNYRLSPHPDFPPDPEARGARHPDHVADVLAALAFLYRRLLRLGRSTMSLILAGHSCGATLAFQAVMSPARWDLAPAPETSTITTITSTSNENSSNGPPSSSSSSFPKPRAVVGFNGLYDLAGFISSPPAEYEQLRDAYAEFTRGAFGDDEAAWRAACPATAEGWVAEWVSPPSSPYISSSSPAPAATTTTAGQEDDARGRRKEVVLVQSREDTLVPYEQLEVMRAYLERETPRGSLLRIREMEAGGDHDDIWRDGRRMAEILWEVVAQGLDSE